MTRDSRIIWPRASRVELPPAVEEWGPVLSWFGVLGAVAIVVVVAYAEVASEALALWWLR